MCVEEARRGRDKQRGAHLIHAVHTRDFDCVQLILGDEGSETSERLPTRATDANQQRVASGLTRDKEGMGDERIREERKN